MCATCRYRRVELETVRNAHTLPHATRENDTQQMMHAKPLRPPTLLAAVGETGDAAGRYRAQMSEDVTISPSGEVHIKGLSCHLISSFSGRQFAGSAPPSSSDWSVSVSRSHEADGVTTVHGVSSTGAFNVTRTLTSQRLTGLSAGSSGGQAFQRLLIHDHFSAGSLTRQNDAMRGMR
jgi:hypothetical protein